MHKRCQVLTQLPGLEIPLPQPLQILTILCRTGPTACLLTPMEQSMQMLIGTKGQRKLVFTRMGNVSV